MAAQTPYEVRFHLLFLFSPLPRVHPLLPSSPLLSPLPSLSIFLSVVQFQAYSLASIISPAVTASLKPYIKELLDCDEDKDRINMLPFKHSEWVKRRVRDLCTMEKPSKEKM